MSLTFKEKFTDSWRGDHSDFGDVQKTTFAKGVISDFEVIGTDPFRVRSMCKVTGDWGESEYIPIYYHPKPQYWDDETTFATAFNETTQYFEKAWMSFRCGDEVKVMLRENVPVFVMGFADNVPRIGEDIVKALATHRAWAKMSEMEKYPDEDIGPDGINLKLLLEADLIAEGGEWINAYLSTGTDPPYQIWSAYHFEGPLSSIIYRGFNQWTLYYEGTESQWSSQWQYINKVIYHLLKVGPILYLLETYIYTTRNETVITRDVPATYELAVGGIYPNPDPYPDPFIWNNGLPTTVQHFYRSTQSIYAALYTDEFYDDIKTNPPTTTWNPINHVANIEALGFHFQYVTPDVRPPGKFDLTQALVDPNLTLQIYMRPHTQDELEAAGLWPEGV